MVRNLLAGIASLEAFPQCMRSFWLEQYFSFILCTMTCKRRSHAHLLQTRAGWRLKPFDECLAGFPFLTAHSRTWHCENKLLDVSVHIKREVRRQSLP
eukprot:1137392-Pelagomonas_calceolata.AAC.2